MISDDDQDLYLDLDSDLNSGIYSFGVILISCTFWFASITIWFLLGYKMILK